MTNADSVILQLRHAGLIVDQLLTGKIIRCKVEGDAEKRGWYKLHEVTDKAGAPLLIGSFGVWQGNDSNTTKIEIERTAFDPDEYQAVLKRIRDDNKQAEAERDRAGREAAQEAERLWLGYQTEGASGYLAKKGVRGYGLRYAPEADTAAMPLCDASGKVWGVQLLRGKDKGAKLEKEYYPKGVQKKGHYHLIGIVRDLVLVCEGYATGASIHEATGLPVAVALDAGNLKPVAEALHKAHKKARILICADDDYLTEGNPGVKAATGAALCVDGAWIKPVFAIDREGKKITDFNDLAEIEGLTVVRAQIQAKVAEVCPTVSTPLLARVSSAEGGGDAMPSKMAVVEAVDRYWGTYGLGGDVVFDETDRRLVAKKDLLNLLPRHGWDDLRDHPDWRVARDTEIGFDPTEKDQSIKCNLFGGWPTEPKEGVCVKLLELLEYLCGNEIHDREVYQWILKWLAYPIQHRGAKMQSAVVVHGPQGTGKSRFFEAYGQIFGPYHRVLGQEALEDKFNADWSEKKLFILADEVLARQDMYHIKNRLKGFITGDVIRVNPKNVAAHTEKNQMNIVFLSNERQPLVLENDDRRHCVIYVPPKLGDDFFHDLNTEIDNGGVAALHYYLLHLGLGDFKPWTRPPMTQAKRDLVDLSISSEERFLREWITGDIEGRDGGIVPLAPCLGSSLYRLYGEWCEAHGERKRGAKDLISLANKIPGWTAGTSCPTWLSLNDRVTKNRKLVVPAENEVTTPQLRRDQYQSKADWLTAGLFAVETAMEVAS